MTQTSMERKILSVIAANTGCDPERIGVNDDFEEVLGLDSLDRLDVGGAFTGQQVRVAIESHALDSASMTGTYALNPRLA